MILYIVILHLYCLIYMYVYNITYYSHTCLKKNINTYSRKHCKVRRLISLMFLNYNLNSTETIIIQIRMKLSESH